MEKSHLTSSCPKRWVWLFVHSTGKERQNKTNWWVNSGYLIGKLAQALMEPKLTWCHRKKINKCEAYSISFLPCAWALLGFLLPTFWVVITQAVSAHRWKHFPGGSDGKASAYNAEDLGLIPGSGRSPGEGNGNPLQYSCLENSMDGGAL